MSSSGLYVMPHSTWVVWEFPSLVFTSAMIGLCNYRCSEIITNVHPTSPCKAGPTGHCRPGHLAWVLVHPLLNAHCMVFGEHLGTKHSQTPVCISDHYCSCKKSFTASGALGQRELFPGWEQLENISPTMKTSSTLPGFLWQTFPGIFSLTISQPLYTGCGILQSLSGFV